MSSLNPSIIQVDSFKCRADAVHSPNFAPQDGEDVPVRGGLHVLPHHRGHRRGPPQGHHQLQQLPGQTTTEITLDFVL